MASNPRWGMFGKRKIPICVRYESRKKKPQVLLPSGTSRWRLCQLWQKQCRRLPRNAKTRVFALVVGPWPNPDALVNPLGRATGVCISRNPSLVSLREASRDSSNMRGLVPEEPSAPLLRNRRAYVRAFPKRPGRQCPHRQTQTRPHKILVCRACESI